VRGSLLILKRRDDRWGVDPSFLSYLVSFFKPVKDLASMNNSIAQTAVAVERIRTILDADARAFPRNPMPTSRRSRARSFFDHVGFCL